MSFGSDDEKYQTMQRFRPLCDSYILIVISQHVSRTLYTNRYRLHGCSNFKPLVHALIIKD